MQNAKLDDSQTGIKIAGRNIKNLRYAVDTTLMAESKEELKKLLMRMKQQSEKTGLKLNIKKKKNKKQDHRFWPHYFMANRRGKCGSSDIFPLLGF